VCVEATVHHVLHHVCQPDDTQLGEQVITYGIPRGPRAPNHVGYVI